MSCIIPRKCSTRTLSFPKSDASSIGMHQVPVRLGDWVPVRLGDWAPSRTGYPVTQSDWNLVHAYSSTN